METTLLDRLNKEQRYATIFDEWQRSKQQDREAKERFREHNRMQLEQ